MQQKLPRGQRAIAGFPRFGLSKFARRFPQEHDQSSVTIRSQASERMSVFSELTSLDRVEQCSDFHCVTTWSSRSLKWGGYRFSDFWQTLVVPDVSPTADEVFLILKGQDGARACMLLEDLLAEDVLLADRLDGLPLSIEHGGPLRLVAPAHYGYKSIKFLNRIIVCKDFADYRPSAFRFMDHPRARVNLEERGQFVPGWLLRYLYRPLINPTIREFEKTMTAHFRSNG